MPSMWWDCAPLMAAECLAGRVPLLAPRLGGLRRGRAPRASTACSSTASTPTTSRASSSGWPGRRACWSGCRRASRRRARSPSTSTSWRRYYAGERPSRRRRLGGRRRAGGSARWHGRPRRAAADAASPSLGRRPHAPTSLSIVNQRVCERLSSRSSASRATAPLDAPLPARRRGRGAPPVAARPAPAALRAPGRDPALGVRRDPARLGRAAPRERRRALGAERVRARDVRRAPASSAERVHVVPNGVDLERFAPDGAGAARSTRPPALRFLFVGGAIARKGVRRAARRLARRRSPAATT